MQADLCFFEQMDNLLGDKPSISAQHTMESSEANSNLITNINTSDNMNFIENHTDVEPDLEVSSENEQSFFGNGSGMLK